jgi:hypothetical protein
LYAISSERTIGIWVADENYRQDPSLGIKGCRQWVGESATVEEAN